MSKFLKSKHRGFSLIEVAIAVVVIGLVASFALKGRELIHSAKLRSVADQIYAIKIATQTFADKYGSLPGDLTNTVDVLDGSLQNGRGDGVIASMEDVKRFWSHLMASDLLNIQIINGVPQSKIGGCYLVSSNIPNHPGTWIVLCAASSDNGNYKGCLSPEDAYFIDKNYDTGNPNTGEIQAIKSSNAAGECLVNSRYNYKNKNKDCVLLFKIW